MKIALILGTTRIGRKSEKVAQVLLNRLQQVTGVETTLLDIARYPFTVFEERVAFNPSAPEALRDFSKQLAGADAMIWLVPEYNGSYPGAFKNAFDHFRSEYTKKPVGICCVSDGKFAGIQASLQLQPLALHVGAFPVPTKWLVPGVTNLLDDAGNLADEAIKKSLERFITEYLWFCEAIVTHKQRTA